MGFGCSKHVPEGEKYSACETIGQLRSDGDMLNLDVVSDS